MSITSAGVPVHVTFVNTTDFIVELRQSSEGENQLFCETISPHDALHRTTNVGCIFEFVHDFAKPLYVSLNEETSHEPRLIQYRPSPGEGAVSSDPIHVYIHRTRFRVQADVESVDALGRPLHSDVGEPTYAAFLNRSHKSVDVFWLNYQGIRVHYGCIHSGDRMLMDTYVTHPWIFFDVDNYVMRTNDSKEQKYSDSRRYFFPPLCTDRNERVTVTIHSEILSLKDLALLAVRELVRSKGLRLTSRHVPKALIREIENPLPKLGYLSLDEHRDYSF